MYTLLKIRILKKLEMKNTLKILKIKWMVFTLSCEFILHKWISGRYVDRHVHSYMPKERVIQKLHCCVLGVNQYQTSKFLDISHISGGVRFKKLQNPANVSFAWPSGSIAEDTIVLDDFTTHFLAIVTMCSINCQLSISND